MDDSPLLALEDRIRSINPHVPIFRTNFCKVDSKALLNISVFSCGERDFLQSDGAGHVHDNIVSSVSWSFPTLELNDNELQGSDRLIDTRVRYQIVQVQWSLGSETVAGRSSSAKTCTCHFLAVLRQT